MLNLVKNENMKIYRRISTWIMIGILILLVVGVALIVKFVEPNSGAGDWKANLTQQNMNYQNTISQSKGNSAMKEQFEKLIKLNEYRIDHDISPDSDKTVWGFVMAMKDLIMIIALFIIIIGANVTANEFSTGTIKLLLIRPVKRWKILLSKYIATLLTAIIMLLILFVISFIVGGLFFGFKGVSVPYLAYTNGAVKEASFVFQIFFQYGLKCVDMLMMVTLAFMISTVFRNNALAIGIGVFLMFVGGTIVQIFSKLNCNWVKYILFANTDLTQYFDGIPVVKGMTLAFSLTVLAIYFVIFNLIAWTVFLKRDVAA